MARPLRIEVKEGWYHVINRGIERRRIFKSASDYDRFVKVLAEFPSRFDVRVHAYALMPNHYHLLLQTPQANLSQAMQWLNVSYSIWFNRKHDRVGPLFQGRFKAVLIAPDGPLLEVSRYLHLHPVRTRHLEPAKGGAAGERQTPAALIETRVQHLRTYGWSSFPVYGGLKASPVWLTTRSLLQLVKGDTDARRRRAFRHYVEEPVRAGVEASILDGAPSQLVMGNQRFVATMLALAKGEKARHRSVQRRNQALPWNEIQAAVNAAKQEPWEKFCNRRGDAGRDLALLVARRFGRYSLAELGGLVGVTYGAVAQAVGKAEKRIVEDREAATLFAAIQKNLKLKA